MPLGQNGHAGAFRGWKASSDELCAGGLGVRGAVVVVEVRALPALASRSDAARAFRRGCARGRCRRSFTLTLHPGDR